MRRLAHAAAAAAAVVLAAAVTPAAPGGAAPVTATAAPAARAPILPPANPRYSLPSGRYLPTGCVGVRDSSGPCLRGSLAMIDAGRRAEHLGPVVLPVNWARLPVAQQLFVLAELERTARGLAPDPGLSAALGRTALTAADAGRDPESTGLAGLWAGGEPNAIVVVADWVYEDGRFADGFTENLSCSAAHPSSCWQHRDLLLHRGGPGPCGVRCAVGAAYSPTGYRAPTGAGRASYAAVYARRGGSETFTWTAERPLLPACERSRDTCAWTGRPLATGRGIVTVRIRSSSRLSLHS
ncbi:MAG TPA: hypothetical protein VFN36_05565 [Solirubrobacteraceae bacterium]|nr:hypothetical protein [Solirubrobacteraceae bacterium]